MAVPKVPLSEYALSLDAACASLDLPRSTLDKLCARGDGPRAFKIGRRWYVRRADLHAWIDELARQK